MHHLYIIYSEGFDKYYVGISKDAYTRLKYHNAGEKNTYTRKYRPWELVALFEADTQGAAVKAERLIKKQKSKIFIKKLIDPGCKLDGNLSELVRVPHVRD